MDKPIFYIRRRRTNIQRRRIKEGYPSCGRFYIVLGEYFIWFDLIFIFIRFGTVT